MSCPSFIDIEEKDQVLELRAYLISKGAEISEDNSPDGPLADVRQLIEAASTCWKQATTEGEIEIVFNGIISLIHYIPEDKVEPLVVHLCEKLAKPQADKKNGTRLRLLSNLFHGISERSSLRYTIYTHLIRLAGQADLMNYVNPKLDEIKQWIAAWDISTDKVQLLLRTLHEAFVECKQQEKATKVMLELLATYTEENASQAREDAQKCIVTCLLDPNMFIMDQLLTLKPVKFLEGAHIHDLLTIFITGNLSNYLDFYEKNKSFVDSLNLNHENNLVKMRYLTFMHMAENNKEIAFSTIAKELQIEEDKIESFIIEAVRSKTVRAKIDQMAQRVIISSTTNRTFNRQQWQQLQEKLGAWKVQLNTILNSLHSVSNP